MLLLGIAAPAFCAATGAELKAGIARVDLTPPLEMKAALGGYGARMSKPAVGVHDRIFAKALVLSDGTKRFVLVTADVLAFPPGFQAVVVAAVADAGWKREQIMLLPSHSHTSIDMTALNPRNILAIPQIGVFHPELYQLTVANLAKVIREADKELVPVRAATHSIELDGWNRNRRRGNTTCDRALTITRIDTKDGSPLAVLVNWTAHPTLMDSDDMMFSGGWPGHLQRTVEALIGDDVTVMYYNGAQGDQSPTPRADSGGNWEQAERYGRELGIIVWREWQKIEPAPAPAFSYAFEEIALPERTWHPDFMETGGAEYGLDEQIVGKILKLMVPTRTFSGSLRLGDLLLVGVPGEMAAGLGLSVEEDVRRATGVRHAVIGGLANEWVSYILTPEEYKKGGYESSVSFYGETLGPTIAQAAVKCAGQLKN
jgi:hypothetical protein